MPRPSLVMTEITDQWSVEVACLADLDEVFRLAAPAGRDLQPPKPQITLHEAQRRSSSEDFGSLR